jgi:RNase adaptor protein for sRNA GlmZ degradation
MYLPTPAGDAAALANHFDTSDLAPNAPHWVRILSLCRKTVDPVFESFGFRYGIPLDADRCSS